MFKAILSRIQTHTTPPPQNIPPFLHQLIVRFTGGTTPTGRLIRELGWKYRLFIIISLVANLFAAFSEGLTLALLTIALELLANGDSAITDISVGGDILQQVYESFGFNAVFIGLVIAAVLMQISRSWLDYLAQAAAAYLASWSEGELRRRLLTQYTNLSYTQISRFKLGNLTSYINEVDRSSILVNRINAFVSNLTITISYGLILLWLFWQMTAVVIVGMVFLTIALRRTRSKINTRSRAFMKAYVSINEQFVELLRGIRLIHTFGRQQHVQGLIRTQIDASVRSRRQALTLRFLIPAIIQTITIIGVALFLSVGYFIIQYTNNFDLVPRLATFVFVIYRMLPRVTGINATLGVISESLPFVMRVADQLDLTSQSTALSGEIELATFENEIRFEEVTLQYPNTANPALAGLSFTVKKGQMVAIVGPSGSGKSSVISLLARLYETTAGQIYVDNLPFKKLNRESWLGHIGLVDQDTFVFNDSILENIRFGRLDATQGEIIQAAKNAYADEFIQKFENKYDTIVGDHGNRLSGGQRQRLAIARALVRQPSILLLDEATSALDSQSEQLIQEALDQLRHEKTILVVAHRLSTIAKADHIIVLNNGQVTESGTHKELLAQKGTYHSMWQLQSG